MPKLISYWYTWWAQSSWDLKCVYYGIGQEPGHLLQTIHKSGDTNDYFYIVLTQMCIPRCHWKVRHICSTIIKLSFKQTNKPGQRWGKMLTHKPWLRNTCMAGSHWGAVVALTCHSGSTPHWKSYPQPEHKNTCNLESVAHREIMEGSPLSNSIVILWM